MKQKKFLWGFPLILLLFVVVLATRKQVDGFGEDPYLKDLKRSLGYSVQKPKEEPAKTYSSIYNDIISKFSWADPSEETIKVDPHLDIKNEYGEDSREYTLAKLLDSPKRTPEEIKKFMSLYRDN